jgi:hypothetical protein
VTQVEFIDEKTEGRKSRENVPLKPAQLVSDSWEKAKKAQILKIGKHLSKHFLAKKLV